MRIAVISTIDERIPPIRYGGVGRVVYNLVTGLVKRGHDITLLGPSDSRVSAKLISIISHPFGVDNEYGNDLKVREAYFQISIAKILETLLQEEFDVVSNHLGWRLIPFYNLVTSPLITTMHAPLNERNKQIILKAYKRAPIITVSNVQRRQLPGISHLGTIYNGIDLSLFDFSDSPEDYIVFLGRMSPEKGALEAISIARKLNIKLFLAGAVHSWDKHYFRLKIKPHLANKNIVFLGEVGDKEKNKLLRNAKALLAPIRWEEPFGLTFIEALACGTPVIALDRGSVREIVEDKLTGIVATSTDEICNRFKEIGNINRFHCRQVVEQKFSKDKMVSGYEKVFLSYLKKIDAKN